MGLRFFATAIVFGNGDRDETGGGIAGTVDAFHRYGINARIAARAFDCGQIESQRPSDLDVVRRGWLVAGNSSDLTYDNRVARISGDDRNCDRDALAIWGG